MVKYNFFFIHRLASRKAYQKKKKKDINDAIITRSKDINISKVLKNMHVLKTNSTSSRICCRNYSFIDFIPNFINALYIRK
jgi:hypothetical protein